MCLFADSSYIAMSIATSIGILLDLDGILFQVYVWTLIAISIVASVFDVINALRAIIVNTTVVIVAVIAINSDLIYVINNRY
jgi:hypothetical protein